MIMKQMIALLLVLPLVAVVVHAQLPLPTHKYSAQLLFGSHRGLAAASIRVDSGDFGEFEIQAHPLPQVLTATVTRSDALACDARSRACISLDTAQRVAHVLALSASDINGTHRALTAANVTTVPLPHALAVDAGVRAFALGADLPGGAPWLLAALTADTSSSGSGTNGNIDDTNTANGGRLQLSTALVGRGGVFLLAHRLLSFQPPSSANSSDADASASSIFLDRHRNVICAPDVTAGRYTCAPALPGLPSALSSSSGGGGSGHKSKPTTVQLPAARGGNLCRVYAPQDDVNDFPYLLGADRLVCFNASSLHTRCVDCPQSSRYPLPPVNHGLDRAAYRVQRPAAAHVTHLCEYNGLGVDQILPFLLVPFVHVGGSSGGASAFDQLAIIPVDGPDADWFSSNSPYNRIPSVQTTGVGVAVLPDECALN